MEIVNRYYIMAEVLGRRGIMDHFRFAVMMAYMTLGALRSPTTWMSFPMHLAGLIAGFFEIAMFQMFKKN